MTFVNPFTSGSSGPQNPFLSGAPSPSATPQARRARKTTQQKPQGGGGGFLSDLAGGITSAIGDVVPDLGIGNVGKMVTGFIPGLYHLGTDWATQGLTHNKWGTYTNAGKGFAQSFADTGATLAKPLGGDFWYEPGIKALSGYKPRDILERARDKNQGLLPAIINDVGNVALVGGTVAKVAKAGELGTAADVARLNEEAATRALGTSEMKALSKGTEKLAGSTAEFTPEQIAARQKVINVGETMAHPYQTAFRKVARPLGIAGSTRKIATAVEEMKAMMRGEPQVTEAERVLAQAKSGDPLVPITVEQAQQHLIDTRQAVTDEALAAAKAKLEDIQKQATAETASTVEEAQNVAKTGVEAKAAKADSYDNPAVNAASEWKSAVNRVAVNQRRMAQMAEDAASGKWLDSNGNVVTDATAVPEYQQLAADTAKAHQDAQEWAQVARDRGVEPNEQQFWEAQKKAASDTLDQVEPGTPASYHAQVNYDTAQRRLDALMTGGEPDLGTTLPEAAKGSWTPAAEPQPEAPNIGAAKQEQAAAASAVATEAPPETAAVAEEAAKAEEPMVNRQGEVIQPETPMRSPMADNVTRMRLAATPGWATALVDRLPMPVVDALDKMNGLIIRHDISVVAREMGRYVEVARRAAMLDPALQKAIDLVAKPLIDAKATMRDGTIITRQNVGDILGAEIMARLDHGDILAMATGGKPDPIIKDAMDRIASQGKRIPDEAIQQLNLEPALKQLETEWRRVADERVGTLIGGRLGMKGLEGINEDTPMLTKRQIRMFKAMERDLKRRDLLEGRVQGEIERMTKRIAKADNTIQGIVDRIKVDREKKRQLGEQIKDAYEQKPFNGDAQARGEALDSMVGDTLGEKGGKTIDTVTGEEITSGYGVSLGQTLNGGEEPVLRRVSADAFAADGHTILDSVLDDPIFRDPRIRLGTERHVLANDWVDPLTGETHLKGTEVVDIDATLTHWATSNTNPLESYRPLTRDAAVVIGMSLGQNSVWDFRMGQPIETLVDPTLGNLYSHFIDLALRPQSQFTRWARQIRNTMYDQADLLSRGPEGWGPWLPANLDEAKIDAFMRHDMASAYSWAEAHGYVNPVTGQVKASDLDKYFAQKSIRFNPTMGPKTKIVNGKVVATGEQLGQVMLNLNLDDPGLYKQMVAATKDSGLRERWYHNSHAAVERQFRGKSIVLGDGTKIDAADLMYQLIAVTSFQADPLTNLGNSLNALGNYKLFHKAQTPLLKAYQAGMKRFVSLPAHEQTLERLVEEVLPRDIKEGMTAKQIKELKAGRLGDPLTQTLSANSGMYSKKGSHLRALLAILSGKTLDKWTPEDVLNLNAAFGGERKSGNLADIPADIWAQAREEAQSFEYGAYETAVQQRALALHYGDRAWAKILSFWQNLAAPETSRAVTLDTWMARAFGMKDWSSPGAYAEYTAKIARLADEAGIAPNAMQALIWSYAKQEITRLTHARIWENTDLGVQALGRGEKLGVKGDPILDRLDWELGRNADFAKEEAAAKKAGGPKPTKFKIEKTPDQANLDYVRKTGGEDVTKLKETRDSYLVAAGEANAKLKAGDVEGAQQVIVDWTVKHYSAAVSDAEALDFGDFFNSPNERVATAAERAGINLYDLMDESLLEAVIGRVRGQMGWAKKDQRWMIEMFANGDLGTLVHENLHVLRQIMAPEDVRAIEAAFGEPGAFMWGGKTNLAARREAEELFVQEFMGYLMTGRSKSEGLQPLMQKMRDELALRWKSLPQNGEMQVIVPQRLQEVWDKYLDPPKTATGAQGTMLERLGEFRKAPEGATPEALAGRNTALPGESPAQTLARQKAMDRAVTRRAVLDERVAAKMRRIGQIQKAKRDMVNVLASGGTKSQLGIKAIEQRVAKLSGKLAQELEDPATSRVPPVWQPLHQSMKELWKRAEDDPVLAMHMTGVPKTFQEILVLAAEKGFDPTHVRSFTDAQVQRLVHDTIRLGVPGRNVGEEIVAGTRKPRVSGIPRVQSLDALIAATVEAKHEVQTNELINFLEESGIVQKVEGGVVPKGWEDWSPVRNGIINRKEDLISGRGMIQSPEPTYIIHSQAAKVLRDMGKSYSHWAFKSLGKPSSWWRTFILTLSPRWYINNFVGNFAMATAEGVSLRDWLAAWKSYRGRGEAGGLLQRGERIHAPFADTPGVTGASIYHEFDEPTLVPPSHGRGGLRKDVGGGKQLLSRQARIQAKARISRANEVVDEIARAAVFHRTMRVTGGNTEMAIQRAYAAMVDYGDLGPMERSLVRAIIPFYAWQKGILKIVAKMGYEHPAVFGLMNRLNDLNDEINKDKYGTALPEGYSNIIDVPGIGSVNLRGFNPFADSAQLIRSGGIAESANPLIEAIVRNELGAPSTSRPDAYRVNQFGRLVPATNLASDVADVFSSGLPQAQLAMAASGEPAYQGAQPTPLPQATGRFFGVNVMTPEQIAAIIKRTREAQATLSGQKVAAANVPTSTANGPIVSGVSGPFARFVSPFKSTTASG